MILSFLFEKKFWSTNIFVFTFFIVYKIYTACTVWKKLSIKIIWILNHNYALTYVFLFILKKMCTETGPTFLYSEMYSYMLTKIFTYLKKKKNIKKKEMRWNLLKSILWNRIYWEVRYYGTYMLDNENNFECCIVLVPHYTVQTHLIFWEIGVKMKIKKKSGPNSIVRYGTSPYTIWKENYRYFLFWIFATIL